MMPTAEQSAALKAVLDGMSPKMRAVIAAAYPLEWDEWNEERDSGQRQLTGNYEDPDFAEWQDEGTGDA